MINFSAVKELFVASGVEYVVSMSCELSVEKEWPGSAITLSISFCIFVLS